MKQQISRKQAVFAIIVLVLAAIGLYGIIPQISGFSTSLALLGDAKPALVLAAVAATFCTYIFATLVYLLLSFKKLSFGRTLLVQLSGLLINRIFPAGIGGIGLNYAYLRTNKHTAAQAASVVTLNNGLGFAGHALLAVIVVLAFPGSIANKQLPSLSGGVLLVAAIILTLLLVLSVILFTLRTRLLRQLKSVVKHYHDRPIRLIAALGFSLLLTLGNVVGFWLCCQAVGISIGAATVFVVFTLGVIVGTATPTPGGLGGFEAGLAAGLVAAHVASPLALAAALLYRLVAYWLGLIIGSFAFTVVQARRFVSWT